MNLFFFNGLLLLGLSMASIPDVMVLGSASRLLMEPEIPIKKCRSSRVYSKLQTMCSNLNLKEIPTTLKPGIQALDVSLNRLRELKNDSFSLYTSLTHLDLTDNFILHIEEGTFDKLWYLEVLDLSKNGLTNLPKSLFALPRLRTLFLADNKLNDHAFEVKVTCPLAVLHVPKNELTQVPQIGPLPDLVHMNLSHNKIEKVYVEDMAPFCFLKQLDLSGNSIKFDNCESHIFVAWLQIHKIETRLPFNYTKETNDNCLDVPFSNETLTLKDNCTQIIKMKVEAEKARSTWILVASCVGAFVLCVFVALCCVHKRNKKRRHRLKEEQQLAANNANTELLNSNLQQERT